MDHNEALRLLYGDLITRFKELLKDKSATSTDLNTIRQFLKDNDITSLPTPGGALDELVNEFEDFEDDEIDQMDADINMITVEDFDDEDVA